MPKLARQPRCHVAAERRGIARAHERDRSACALAGSPERPQKRRRVRGRRETAADNPARPATGPRTDAAAARHSASIAAARDARGISQAPSPGGESPDSASEPPPPSRAYAGSSRMKAGAHARERAPAAAASRGCPELGPGTRALGRNLGRRRRASMRQAAMRLPAHGGVNATAVDPAAPECPQTRASRSSWRDPAGSLWHGRGAQGARGRAWPGGWRCGRPRPVNSALRRAWAASPAGRRAARLRRLRTTRRCQAGQGGGLCSARGRLARVCRSIPFSGAKRRVEAAAALASEVAAAGARRIVEWHAIGWPGGAFEMPH